MARLAELAFLFTDIEGSTRLWEEHPDAMRTVLATHDGALRHTIDSHGGRVFKTIGDAFCAVFPDCGAAVAAARAGQEALRAVEIAGHPLRVRMAVHRGDVEERDGDFFGPPLNLIARLLAAGHGGQVLLSDTALEAIGDTDQTRFLGRHRLRDIARPVAIHQWLVPGHARDFPPLKTLAERSAPGNLPHPHTSFVGRESALRDLADQSRRHRLATLIGPGGCGKSRLLLQHGIEQRDRHGDGAWWIDLSGVSRKDGVADAFARALGVPDDPERAIDDQILAFLRDREMVLLVDNCEHMTGTVGRLVVDILGHCPRVRVVAASREALGVGGERRVTVPPLGMPPTDRRVSAGMLERYEATRLFLERARLRQPDFQPGPDDTEAVARVCRRLDGIPLAIELAAARTGTLSVAQIDARLDRRFRLLTGGDRDASPRQQTLRSLIDWSYDLLEIDVRTVFHRLAVFRGGWDLDAAEAVVAGGPIDRDSVLDLLESLVDKSLVAAHPGPHGLRYHLLESLREYGWEKLESDPDARDTMERHARHYAQWARKSASGLAGTRARAVLEQLDAERENLAAALDRLPADSAAALCEDLEEYWHRRGRWREAVERLGDVVARVGSARERGRLLGIRGWFAHLRGDRDAARSDTDQAMANAESVGDAIGTAAALNTAAFLAWSCGDPEGAQAAFERSLLLLTQAGETGRAAGRLANLGLLAAELGDFDEATRKLDLARDAYSTTGDLQGLAACLCNRADVALRRGAPGDAWKCAGESVALFEQLHDGPGLVYSLANRAEAALELGKPADALAPIDSALREFRDPGMRALLPMVLDLRVRALAGLGERASALCWWRRSNAVREAEELPRDPAAEDILRTATESARPEESDNLEDYLDVESWLEERADAG